MKSVNYALRKAYVSSLSSIVLNTVPVPIYYLEAPETETAAAYITLNTVSNTDTSIKSTNDTNTSMQVQIHTWADSGNAGKDADDIASLVYAAIIPLPTSNMDLSGDGFQMVDIRMGNDLTQELTGHGNRYFVTRIITFNHNIFHL